MKKIRRRAAAAALILFFCILCTAQAGATKLVAITFDDGPNRTWTPQVVEALNQRGVKGTFFMVGSWVPTKEELVRQMAAQGHQIANHTWEHANLTDMTPEEVRDQVERSRAALAAVTGQESFLVRTPFGVRTKTVLENIESPLILWSQDPAAGQDRLRGENGEKGDQHHSGRGHHPAARQHAGQSGCRLPHHRYAAAQGI